MKSVNRLSSVAAVLLLAAVAPWTAGAHEEKVVHHDFEEKHGSLANVGKKLNDPTSDVWALFTQFSMTLSDGNVNSGSPVPAGQVSFQPIMPVLSMARGRMSGS